MAIARPQRAGSGLPAGPPDPLDVEDVRKRVGAAIDTFLGVQQRVLDEVAPDCAPLLQVVRALLSRGKRLRPAFCYWGWRGAGGPSAQVIVDAASALELFQAAALIHDDVMDGSDTRRGQPSTHRRFAALHRRRGWSGDPEQFGQAGAILTGDLCLIWCDEMLDRCQFAPGRLKAARSVFDRMRTELMAGQYLDMLEQVTAGSSVQRARQVIRFKSAKYSVEQPLLLGGLLAGAPAGLLAAYSAFGLRLGEAFQLRDDVLGVFGDPATTGKPAGDDLREGKRTVLMALAVQHAGPRERELIRRLLGDARLDDVGVGTLRQVIVDTGALAEVERLISELVEQACQVLAGMDVAAPVAGVLTSLVEAATDRTS